MDLEPGVLGIVSDPWQGLSASTRQERGRAFHMMASVGRQDVPQSEGVPNFATEVWVQSREGFLWPGICALVLYSLVQIEVPPDWKQAVKPHEQGVLFLSLRSRDCNRWAGKVAAPALDRCAWESPVLKKSPKQTGE